MQLLSTEIEEFSSPSNGESEIVYDEAEREKVLLTAGNLRRSLESRISAAARLEATLALPTDASSVGALELSIQSAREAGVHERLLMKAEDRMATARRKSVVAGDRLRGPGTLTRNDSDSSSQPSLHEGERPRCDTTEWPGMGEDDGSENASDKKSKQGAEKMRWRSIISKTSVGLTRSQSAHSPRSCAGKVVPSLRACLCWMTVLTKCHRSLHLHPPGKWHSPSTAAFWGTCVTESFSTAKCWRSTSCRSVL